MSTYSKPLIFCAVDTANLDHAKRLAQTIGPITGGLKLGMEFVNSFGPQGIDSIIKACPTAKLFIDLKFYDIPNTVAAAIKTLSNQFEPAYLNVHASGGLEMMQRAKETCHKNTRLLAVTILTSFNNDSLHQAGYEDGLKDRVIQLATLTKQADLDGVVCSALEIESLRRSCGNDFDLMVPGIRPAGSPSNDQKRIMTPRQAMQAGATHLVIGRPITGANDPAQAAQAIMNDLNHALD